MFLPRPLTFIQKLRARLSRPVAMFLMCVCAVVLVAVSSFVMASQSNRNKPLVYQGRLTTTANVPVADGNYNVSFVIYDALTSGNCKWATGASETSGQTNCSSIGTTSVAVSRGLFTSPIGDDDASITGMPPMNLDFDTASFFLEVRVGGETLTPRKRIGSAPYSYNADEIDGITSGSFLRSDANSTDTAQLSLNAVPTGAGVGAGSAYINPASASANYTLLGIAVNGTQKAKIDAEGDLTTTGNLTVSGTSDSSMTGNMIWSVDNTYDIGASGANRPRRGYFATEVVVGGTVTISTNSIVGSGATTLSSTSGNLTLSTVTSGDIVLTPTGSGKVGVGTASPAAKLQVTAGAGIDVLVATTDQNLAGAWHMDENTGQTTADYSGNANTATLGSTGSADANDPTWTSAGKNGPGLSFDGVNDYVNVPNHASLQLATQFTISTWVKLNSTAASQVILARNDNAGSFEWQFNTHTGTGWEPIFYVGSGSNYGISPGGLSTGTWYHFTWVYDGTASTNATRLKNYVNGAAQTLTFTGTIPSSITTYAIPLTMGGLTSGTFPMNGYLDEVQYYNRALDATEASNLYTYGALPSLFTSSTARTGLATASPTTRLDVSGLTVNTDADGTVGAMKNAATFTKNDTNTRTFSVAKIVPTFNFGGSNTNTTVNVLDIDSTNTAVTGLTTNLLKASYGGAQKFAVDSSGNLSLAGSLGSIAGNLLPSADDSYDLGSSSFRWRDLFLGPTSLRLSTTTGETSTARAWKLGVDDSSGSGPSGFAYRREITITSGASQTNYQIPFTLDTATLISNSKMQADCDDIRVTSSDGSTLIDHFFEGPCNNASTTIWAEVPSIANGSTTIYVYYGNSGASSVSSAANTFVREIASTSPVVRAWRLDENTGQTAADYSGNSGTLTLGSTGSSEGNDPAWTGSGKFGAALSFDGGDRATFSNVDMNVMSVTMWIQRNNTNGRLIMPISSGGWGFYLESSNNLAFGKVGNSQAGLSSGSISDTSSFHQVAFTYDGATVSYYIDGSASGTAGYSETFNSGGSNYTLGSRGDGEYFNGVIDEVRIYNRVLTSGEISDLYNNYGYVTTNYAGKELVRKRVASEPSPSVGSEAGTGSPSQGSLRFMEGSSQYLTVATDGKVGIGTAATAPASLLHVPGIAQLGTASTTTGQLKMFNSGSANYAAIQAGSAGSALTFTWPTSYGTNGQVLTSNGLGGLSWTTPGGGGGNGWTDDGTAVRLTTATDFVAIGTTTAVARLTIEGGGISIGGTPQIGDWNPRVPLNNTTTTVVSTNDVGYYNPMIIAPDGLPIIAHYDGTAGDLKVTKCNDVACAGADETTSTIDSSGTTGQYPSIAIGTDGYAVIAYYDSTNTDLRVAKCSNATCSSSSNDLVDNGAGNNAGEHTSITIGTDGFPVIAYYYGTGADLKVAKCNDAACAGTDETLTTVDSTGSVGDYAAITISPDGYPFISYRDGGAGDLKTVKCGNASCSSGNTITTVDSTGSVGGYSSATIAPDGLPVISYHNSSSGYLHIAKCTNATCSTSTVSSIIFTANVGSFTSIAIAPDGFPIISHHDQAAQDLVITKCGDTSCTSGGAATRAVDTSGYVGEFTSMAIGVDGLPIVSYRDGDNGNLKVVHCANQYCINNWNNR